MQEQPGFSFQSLALVHEYLSDEFMLITRNPDTISGFWEITPARLAECAERKALNMDYQEVIRLTWPAQSLFDLNYVFQPISFSSKHEYLRVPFRNHSYRAELGWLGSDGTFIPVLVSNDSATCGKQAAPTRKA